MICVLCECCVKFGCEVVVGGDVGVDVLFFGVEFSDLYF